MRPDLKIKVCGMREASNIEELKKLEPDFMGLIFYDRSPRHVSGDIPQLPQSIQKTGVFVDASEEFVVEKVEDYRLSAIQLHGNESAAYCESLKSKLKDILLIKVFSVETEFDFDLLKPYEKTADFFLFDTKGKNKGGNGILFEWELLKKYPSKIPFILSGGISLEEVPAIKELYRHFLNVQKEHLFFAVDVNSKFETAAAQKNIQKIRQFKEALFSEIKSDQQ